MPHNISKNNYKVTVCKLGDSDPEKYHLNDIVKTCLMLLDARLMMPEYDTDGEISIIDTSGFSFKHFLKVTANFSTLKLHLKYIQEAAPIRIVQNHFINCSPIIDKLMTLARPFIRSELFDAMHFHKPNSETLFNFVSRDDLPKDFGGNLDSIERLNEVFIAKVREKK